MPGLKRNRDIGAMSWPMVSTFELSKWQHHHDDFLDHESWTREATDWRGNGPQRVIRVRVARTEDRIRALAWAGFPVVKTIPFASRKFSSVAAAKRWANSQIKRWYY